MTFSEPPVVETDWFVPEGGFEAFRLGSEETRYVPEVQFGVVVNCTVREPLTAIWPPLRRMKPSVTTTGVSYAAPPALTVAVTPVGLLKQVGIATSVYLICFAWLLVSVFTDVTRTRTVAATAFCSTGAGITPPPALTYVSVAEGSVVPPMSTGGLSFCSPAVPAVFVKVCMSHSAAFPFWFVFGVVAFTSMRAQSTLFVASPVPDWSVKSTVRLVWFTTGEAGELPIQLPEEKDDAATLMFE